jgi:hypothetical protein
MLVFIKVLHTFVWVLLAGSIVAMPFMALRRRFDAVLLITFVILMEGGILLMNHWRCPLTDMAARYTEDRQDSFDIYLPSWLARNNKTIFTTLFLVNECVVLWYWKRSERN